jgi:hypothetical protein
MKLVDHSTIAGEKVPDADVRVIELSDEVGE